MPVKPEGSERIKVSRYGYLYTKGEPSPVGYRVCSGTLLLCVRQPKKHLIGFGLLRPGDTFGEEVLDELPRRHFAYAIERSFVEEIGGDLLNISGFGGRLADDARRRARMLEELCCIRGVGKRALAILDRHADVHMPTTVIAALCHASRPATSRALALKTSRRRRL